MQTAAVVRHSLHPRICQLLAASILVHSEDVVPGVRMGGTSCFCTHGGVQVMLQTMGSSCAHGRAWTNGSLLDKVSFCSRCAVQARQSAEGQRRDNMRVRGESWELMNATGYQDGARCRGMFASRTHGLAYVSELGSEVVTTEAMDRTCHW